MCFCYQADHRIQVIQRGMLFNTDGFCIRLLDRVLGVRIPWEGLPLPCLPGVSPTLQLLLVLRGDLPFPVPVALRPSATLKLMFPVAGRAFWVSFGTQELNWIFTCCSGRSLCYTVCVALPFSLWCDPIPWRR